MIKIADAAACIREQHDWCARTAGCAFQRHVTDSDVEAIEGRRLRFKEPRLGGSRTSAGYEARSGSCKCAGEQATARQSRFGHLIHSLTAWILWSKRQASLSGSLATCRRLWEKLSERERNAETPMVSDRPK